MANRILKNNDFTPYWIQLGKDIDADTDKFWKEVEEFKRYTFLFINEKHIAATLNRFEKKKSYFYTEKRLQLEKLKKKILDYNLHCPVSSMGRPNIDVDDEMSRIIENTEKLIQHSRKHL
jgi:hypothetical protein